MRKSGGYIYAIAMQDTPYVKIGSTSGTVKSRLQSLQTGQPFQLTILTSIAIDGDLARIERYIHQFLAEQRKRGEWFEGPIDEKILGELIARALEFIAAEEAFVTQIVEDRKESPETLVFYRGFYSRLRRRRQSLGLSGGEVALAIGMAPSQYSVLEAGKQRTMQLQQFAQLAQALQTTADFLLGLTPEAGPVPL